jgi:hypothetical protein
MSPNNFPVLGYDDLATFQKSAAGNNFLLNLGPGISGAKLDMRTWSPEAQVGTSFAQGFLGALFQGMGRDQVADQTRQAAALLPLLYQSPESVQAPEGVDPQAFEALRGAAQLTKLQQQAFRQQQAQELWNDLYKAKLLEDFKAEAGATAAGKEAFNKVMGENTAWDAIRKMGAGEGDIGEIANPKDPRYQVGQDRIKNADDLRRQLEAKTGDFANVLKAADAISGALKDYGRVSDQELVRYSIQMIEPGMAVREGEQAAIANSQAVPDAWKAQLKGALDGTSTLGKDARDGIARLASRAYNAQRRVYDKAVSYYDGLATARGLLGDGQTLSYLGAAPDVEEIFGLSSTPRSDGLSSASSGSAPLTSPVTQQLLEIRNKLASGTLTQEQRMQELERARQLTVGRDISSVMR